MNRTDWDYYRPGPGTGLQKQSDGTYRTSDARFQVTPANTEGASWRYRVKDTETERSVRARTLLDARNAIRAMREEG